MNGHVLSPKKILPIFNILWNDEGELLEAGSQPRCGGLICCVSLNSEFVDLEPITLSLIFCDIGTNEMLLDPNCWISLNRLDTKLHIDRDCVLIYAQHRCWCPCLRIHYIEAVYRLRWSNTGLLL